MIKFDQTHVLLAVIRTRPSTTTSNSPDKMSHLTSLDGAALGSEGNVIDHHAANGIPQFRVSVYRRDLAHKSLL